jgi:hypothetical protein
LVLFENKCEKLYGKRIDDSAVPGEIATLKELVALSDTTGKSFQTAKVMETHKRRAKLDMDLKLQAKAFMTTPS